MTYDPPKPTSGVAVYGASDDLIEIIGDVTEEFTAWMNPAQHVLVTASDGTLASVRWDEDGVWRIDILATGTGNPTVDTCPDAAFPFGDGRYTDVLTIGGPIEWVRAGEPEVRP